MDNHGDGKQEQFKKEMRSDMEKGLAFVKRGVVAFQKMAGELAEEGKRQYAVAATKSKIRDAKRDLGDRVYTLLSKAETQNPALDEEVKAAIARIRGLEEELAKLGSKSASSQTAGPAPGPVGGEPAKAQGKADEAPASEDTTKTV